MLDHNPVYPYPLECATVRMVMKQIESIKLSWRERLFRSAFPFVMTDILAIVMAYYLTLLIRFYSPFGKQFFTWINVTFGLRETAEVGCFLEHFYLYNAPRILLLLSTTLIFLYAYMNLYAGRRLIRRLRKSWTVVLANLVALAAYYAYFYLTRNDFHPRSVFATLLAINAILTITLRSFTSTLLRHSGLARCRVLLAGTGPECEYIDRYITLMHPEGLEVVTRLSTAPAMPADRFLESVRNLVREHKTHLILCAERSFSVAEIMQLLEAAESLGQEVKILSNRLNVLVNEAGIPSDFFMELPLVHFAISPVGTAWHRIRQTLERGLALALLILFLPFLFAIAILIKLSSPGPVFFMQDRIGINRIPFRMYKFRTMQDRAEELQAQIEEFNESGEGLFKIKHDPRVTRIGRLLRRFSLDELPQLINVVRGEMTLVGPRPLPRRDFENYYEEWHYSRHGGLPGLTCLWQVSGRSDISFHNMCILDDYYLRNQNAMLDLKILLRTIGVVLFAKGAY